MPAMVQLPPPPTADTMSVVTEAPSGPSTRTRRPSSTTAVAAESR